MKRFARSRPSARSSPARATASLDPGRDRRRVERVDEHRRVAGDLLERARRGRDDGRAARHRLEDRDPEALVQRGVDEAARAAKEARELRVRHEAEPAHAVARQLDAAPAGVADDAQLGAGEPRGLGDPGQVLPRLERSDGEHVVALGARPVRREGRVDAVRDDPHALLGHVEQLDDLAAA